MKTDYRSYLKSEHWKQLRHRFFRRSKRVISMRRKYGCTVCEFCKRGRKFNLHHKTYERLGRERLTDLVILCDDCHKRVHSICAPSLQSATRRVRKLHLAK